VTAIPPGRQLVLDRRRDQLETDIKNALNFLHGGDLVIRLMQAADRYAGKCCEAAEPHAVNLDREEAFGAWWDQVAEFAAHGRAEAVAHEAFCVGFERAAAAERERIIQLASQLRATIPADHPPGAQASFADYLRVTAAGDAP